MSFGFSNVAWVGSLARSAAPPPMQDVNYAAYALALKSYEGANTANAWQDLSGHGKHALQSSTGFALTANLQNGKAGYRATAASAADTRFNLPSLNEAVGEYTVTLALRVDEATNCYVLLAGDGSGGADFTYFGINSTDTNAYFQRRVGSPIGPVVALAAGRTAIVQYRLFAAGASVLIDGVVVGSGLNWAPARWQAGTLGNQLQGQLLHGALFGLFVAIGNQSDAEMAAVRAMFAADLGL